MSFRVSRQRKLRIDLALIKITCNLKLKLTCNRTRPKLKGGGGTLTRQDKTRQCFIWSLIQSYVYRLYPNNLKL